jgi:hypothetical protein
MTYLEDAAAQLYAARDDNDERARDAADMCTGMAAAALAIGAEVNARRMEIAAGFTRLAAIEAGLPPCLGGHGITEEGSAGA